MGQQQATLDTPNVIHAKYNKKMQYAQYLEVT